MSQRTILVAQVVHFLDLMMKFKTSPVMRKNKADENKTDADDTEKQVGEEEPIQSMVDVPIHQEDPAVQRTPLVDTVISMVTEMITSTPTPPTTQAQVTNVPESNSSLKFEQRHLELEKKVEAMLKRAWTKKDQKWTDEMVQMIDNAGKTV
ncbi:hypothetical protein Tco_0576003 [Tanacetum coccineum]